MTVNMKWELQPDNLMLPDYKHLMGVGCYRFLQTNGHKPLKLIKNYFGTVLNQ